MLPKPIDLPLSDTEWDDPSPATKQGLLTLLWAEVTSLRAEVQRLQAALAALHERVQQNSTNSSRPPSSDPPGRRRPGRPPSGRRPGGQPGRTDHGHTLLPVDQVDAVVPVRPTHCRQCGAALSGDDPHARRYQVTDIPPVRLQVTEYQLHTLRCAHCDTLTEAAWPEGVPTGSVGPRLQALVGLLGGAYRLSRRQIQGLLADAVGVELSLGTVHALEQATAAAVAVPVEEAEAYVQQQDTANVDETGWKEGRERAWLWTVVTRWVTIFTIAASRGSQVVKQLLGELFGGVVGSDRGSAYSYLPLRRRQLCWAHLRRELEAMRERGADSAVVATPLLAAVDRMFHWWHRVRDGTLQRRTFQGYMRPVQTQVREYLQLGQQASHAKTAAFCRKVLAAEEALWTFVRCPGVEPTNGREGPQTRRSLAPQQLRHAHPGRQSCRAAADDGDRHAAPAATRCAGLPDGRLPGHRALSARSFSAADRRARAPSRLIPVLISLHPVPPLRGVNGYPPSSGCGWVTSSSRARRCTC
ncbi:MAG: IS66 family transposase, partial [Candidatus Latescibacterota bacterium]